MAESLEDPFQMDEDLPSYSDHRTVKSDITPRYSMAGDIRADHEYIRSQLDHVRLEEMRNRTTTEEEEGTFEEDVDDNFDKDNAKQIELEYIRLQQEQQLQPLAPPENFAPVVGKIYRSSFPQPNNFSFVRLLKLKAILCLIPEEYPEIHKRFFKEQGIELFQLGMSGNKEPFVIISDQLLTEALKIVLNPANHPILIHCNRGKHRTGCLVGVLRRLQQWSLTIIFDEYRKFAAPKERPMDQQFIELYNDEEVRQYAETRGLLPLKWD